MKERAAYQRDQARIYINAKRRFLEAKKTKMQRVVKFTDEEQNAIDYFNGKGIYKYYQSIDTKPNKFDTKQTYLKKMENLEVREKILNCIHLNPNVFI